MAVRVLEHEPACVWAYGALKLADVWKKEGGGGRGVVVVVGRRRRTRRRV